MSGSHDRTVRLWNAATGATLQKLKGHNSAVLSVDFSPDSKQVISGSDDDGDDWTVWLWDAATGAALQTLEADTDFALSPVHSVAFSPDGKLPTLRLSNDWVTEGGKKFLWLPPDYRSPNCVDVWNKNLVLGYSSGRVSIIGFREG